VAWDSSRPVAYRRLFKEWLIYAAIMAALFLLLMRDEANEVSLLFGLLASLPLYIGFSYVLAKFGYQRKTLADLRTPRATTTAETTSSAAATPARHRPAPTRRTAGGANRPGQRPASRRRR
jgi:hypothetical protein